MEITIPQEAIEMSHDAENMLTTAKAFKIATVAQYQGAAADLKAIKAKAKELDTTRKSLTSPLDESKKRIMDFFRAPLQFLTDAEAAIKRSMISFDQEQERIRRAEEARLQEMARKEQARLDKLAEQRAARAEAKGDTEKAEEIRESVPVVQTPILPTEQPKVAGITRRTTWSGEVTDKMALIKAVAAGSAPANLLDVNTTNLNAMARALKGEMAWPGVRAVESHQIAA